MNAVLVVAGIVGMFLLLIAPHEAGHFALAKLFKVRVIEFSIGAGTKLWSMTRGGTVYAIRALPILGYVRMGGMEAGDFEDPNGFHRKAAWQRILILIAGPAANFLVAMVIAGGIELTQLNTDPGKVLTLVPGSPAASVGMQSGDSIRTVNGKPVNAIGLVKDEEGAAPGAPLVLTGVHPNGKPFTVTVTPKTYDSKTNTWSTCDLQNPCQIGIGMPRRLIGWQTAVTDGVKFPFVVIGGLVTGLSQLVTGEVPGGLLGPNGVTGPIGIGEVATQAVGLGFDTYLGFVALLSVALGFTNLLPFLALDGGRIVVVVIEALRRRPFNRTAELNVQRFGLVTLLALAVYISALDIIRIASGQFPVLQR
ncbi:MAG TPA: M50 family metallopeptidase [Candidatus Limnocylindrales bacterium]|nr:M50 family metallopeptidase [Candidatus Limnocylindrales bacterium]